MRTSTGSTTRIDEHTALRPQAWWRQGRCWLLGLLALQYIVFQLLSGAQYYDGPRNMHWGIYLTHNPAFAVGAPNENDRINGFPPVPRSLAPVGRYTDGPAGGVSPWWGPFYLLLFGLTWRVTGSYLALHLLVPLAAGAAVLVTYAFGARLFGKRTALVAAVLLALFPNYRDTASVALVEPISALLITGAFWAFLERRAALAALLASLAMLGKIDMIAIYLGVTTIVVLCSPAWRRSFGWRRLALALGVPFLVGGGWAALIYGYIGRPTTVTGRPSLAMFELLMPMILDQLFVMQIIAALPVVTVILAAAVLALVRRRNASGEAYRLLGAWVLLGMLTSCVFASMRDVSNNPRIFIPALPALFLLAADGLALLRPLWRRAALAFVLSFFVLVNSVGVVYQVLQGQALRVAMPAWERLQNAPRGFVLTEHYWQAALYARQPATWFEGDLVFERNIMHDEANFRRYLAANPIHYVVLPRADDGMQALRAEPLYQIYEQLPIGRDLGWRAGPLASPRVRAYLERTFPAWYAGEYVVFVVRPDAANGAWVSPEPPGASARGSR